MGKFLCDGCENKTGTYRPKYESSDGRERRIAIEYVICSKRSMRRKIEADDPCGCLDFEKRGK